MCGQVDLRFAATLEPPHAHIPDDSRDRAVKERHVEPPTDRVRPMTPGEGFTDDRHEWRVARVAVGDVAPVFHGNLQRREVTWRDEAQPDRVLIGTERGATAFTVQINPPTAIGRPVMNPGA